MQTDCIYLKIKLVKENSIAFKSNIYGIEMCTHDNQIISTFSILANNFNEAIKKADQKMAIGNFKPILD